MIALRSILRLELVTIVRDRSTWLGLLGFALFVFSGLPLQERLVGYLEAEQPPLPPVSSPDTPASSSPVHPDTPVAFRGPRPDWLYWDRSFVGIADADVVLEADDAQRVIRIHADELSTARSVRDELLDAAHAHRQAWLGTHGIQPERLVDVRASAADPDDDWTLPPLSVPGSLAGMFALMLAGAFAIEAVPRRRSSGLLEQLRSTRTSTLTLIGAWWLALLVTASTYAALMVGVYYVSATLWGEVDVPWTPALHAAPHAAIVGALSIRTSLTARDTQAATIRWFLVLALLVAGSVLALANLQRPWLAALVPLGGTQVSTIGLLGTWSVLADGMALVYSAALLLWCSRLLDTEDDSGADPALRRQASGNYLPEVLTLTAIGVTAAILPVAVPREHAAAGTTVAFALLMGLPAWMAPTVLALPRRTLLPLPRPHPRNLILAVPLTIGAIGLSMPVLALTQQLLPASVLVKLLDRSMMDLITSPGGLLVIGVVPGVCEELLFRGAILGLLERRFGRPLANLGQALLFGLAHGMAVRLPWTFVFGLLMGWIRQRTQSLWPTILLHALFNITLGAIAYFAVDPMLLGEWTWLVVLPGLLLLPLYRPAAEVT